MSNSNKKLEELIKKHTFKVPNATGKDFMVIHAATVRRELSNLRILSDNEEAYDKDTHCVVPINPANADVLIESILKRLEKNYHPDNIKWKARHIYEDLIQASQLDSEGEL